MSMTTFFPSTVCVSGKKSMVVNKNLFFFGFLIFAFVLLLIFPGNADASTNTDFVSNIVKKFAEKGKEWEDKITVYAEYILGLFATFELCYIGIRISLGRENIGDAIKQLVMLILMAGFFLAVIHNYHEWSWNLINGLKGIGDKIGAPAAAADAPFTVGLGIIKGILKKVSGWTPIDSLCYIIVGLVVLVCFALIAARVVLIKCEACVAMAAALLLVGFGGSSLTKDYGINAIRYVLSVAFKLFVMQMVMGVGLSFINDFADSTDWTNLFTIIGASIVLLALVASLPDTVAGIISGSHIGGGTGLGAAATGVVGGAIGAIAGGAAAVGAGKNLSAASKMADMAGATGFGKVGHMAKNLMSAGREAKDKSKPTRSSIMRERLAAAQQEHNKG